MLELTSVYLCFGLISMSLMHSGALPTESVTPKNVIFIVADDLALRDEFSTPNIDRLRAKSMSFSRMYAQVSKCSPSRMSYLTGRRPDDIMTYANGYQDFRQQTAIKDLVTLPQFFKDNGYLTAGIGKTYHGNDPKDNDPPSWTEDHWPSDLDDEISRFERMRAPWSFEEAHVAPDPFSRDDEFIDYAIATQTLDTIKKLSKKSDRKEDRGNDAMPFFIHTGFRLPHTPWQMPARFYDMYNFSSFTMEEELTHVPQNAPDIALTFSQGKWIIRHWKEDIVEWFLQKSKVYKTGEDWSPHKPLPMPAIEELRRGYAACVSFMDEQLGRILDTVWGDPELAASTIIAFSSDHGFALSELGLWKKQALYDYTTHVPFIIHDPSRPDTFGGVSSSILEMIDIYPSLADMAGLSVPPLPGISFRPLLEQAKGAEPTKLVAFSQQPRCPPVSDYPSWARDECSPKKELSGVAVMGYAVRSADFRYVEWLPFDFAIGQVLWYLNPEAIELYDHSGEDSHGAPAHEGINVAVEAGYLIALSWSHVMLYNEIAGDDSLGVYLAHIAHNRWFAQSADQLVFSAAVDSTLALVVSHSFESCEAWCLSIPVCQGFVVFDDRCEVYADVGPAVASPINALSFYKKGVEPDTGSGDGGM